MSPTIWKLLLIAHLAQPVQEMPILLPNGGTIVVAVAQDVGLPASTDDEVLVARQDD